MKKSSSPHHLWTPLRSGLEIYASRWAIMLHETGIPFWLWISEKKICCRIGKFQFLLFQPLGICLRRQCIFLPLHSCMCSACLITRGLEVRTRIMVPDIFFNYQMNNEFCNIIHKLMNYCLCFTALKIIREPPGN